MKFSNVYWLSFTVRYKSSHLPKIKLLRYTSVPQAYYPFYLPRLEVCDFQVTILWLLVWAFISNGLGSLFIWKALVYSPAVQSSNSSMQQMWQEGWFWVVVEPGRQLSTTICSHTAPSQWGENWGKKNNKVELVAWDKNYLLQQKRKRTKTAVM